jgi:asparagine synthase (glutamine-hydrolysing)
MSAFGGFFSFDGAAVSRECRDTLCAHLARYGPLGNWTAAADGMWMTYWLSSATTSPDENQQPCRKAAGLTLAWNGRLDNRTALAHTLGIALDPTVPDGALILAAYERHGLDFASHLRGEFALALHDAHARRLVLARDPAGVRTLYYQSTRARLLWSTDLGALVEQPDTSSAINDDYVADFLTRGPNLAASPFANIMPVPPAHAMVFETNGVKRQWRYWQLSPDATINYRTDAEYEEHFSELFFDAVGTRLRTPGCVFAELSGGLDSSSIVCAADRLIAEHKVPASRLETVSYVLDESRTADETKYIRHVEEHRRRATHVVRESEFPYFSAIDDQTTLYTLSLAYVLTGFENRMTSLLREHDAHVLLSGQGGDQLLYSTNDPAPELADLLVSGRWLALFDRTAIWSATLKRPYVDLLWHCALAGAVTPRWSRLWPGKASRASAPWLRKRFVADFDLKHRLVDRSEVEAFRRPSTRDSALSFASAIRLIADGHRQELGGRDLTYPYLHAPLVEFMQAIPFSQKVRPGESRSLMRRSLRGVLPEAIRKRRGKPNSSEVVARGMGRVIEKLRPWFRDPLVAQRGYVDAPACWEAIHRTALGGQTDHGMLLRVIVLELWLRRLESRSRPSTAHCVAANGDPARRSHHTEQPGGLNIEPLGGMTAGSVARQ